LHTVSNVNW